VTNPRSPPTLDLDGRTRQPLLAGVALLVTAPRCTIWYMTLKPVRVSVDVPDSREDVYDFLDVMANHEPFTNHILRDWEYSGPDRGIGSKARVHVTTAGRTDVIDMEVVAAQRPETIVEQNVGAGGRRVANGTYTLEELPSGGTRIVFEYAWKQAPLSERLGGPVVRSVLRRANERAMQRLAEQLAARRGVSA
jgi:carbon monoxide dehydrogenase subunit G